MATAAQIQGIYRRVLRRELNSIVAEATASAINSNQVTLQTYMNNLVSQAVNSTRPALLVTNYMEGAIADTARLDGQTTFCRGQYEYYVSIGSSNADLGPYEAMGKAFWAEASFQGKIAGKTLSQVISDAYTVALGSTPGAEQIAHFTAQHDYFVGLYTGAGESATNAALQAKGAVVGQILGYGARSATTFNGKATTWLNSAANGTETYSVPL